MTFALIFAKIGGLLSKVAWWVWLLVAVFFWGFIGRVELKHERADRKTEQVAQAKKIKLLEDEKAAVEATWKAKYASIAQDRERDLRSAIADRDAALIELRKRPARRPSLPSGPDASCAGSTGAELAGTDAQFLERYAAIARGLQLSLAACQAREAVIK